MMESACPAAALEPQRMVRYPSQQQSDRRRAKTRVNIGKAFARWTQIKDSHGIRTHAEMATFLLDRYDKLCAILLPSTGTCRQKPAAPSRPGCVAAASFVEMQVTIEEEEEESNSVKNRLSDLDSDTETASETTELSAPGADKSCDGDVYVPEMPQRTDLERDTENAIETTELSAPGADNSCDGDVYVPVMCQSHKTSELKLECEEEELEPWQKHTLHVRLKEEHDVGELSDDKTDCKPDPSSLQSWAAGQHTVTPEACVASHTSEGHQISNNPLSLSSVQSPEVYAASSDKLQSDQSNSQTLSVLFPPPCLTAIKLEPNGT
uniref:uncharacterized protein LOC117254623 isoform X2 n=1 Tax=Epinephelus lanceolatus TaxID=310571 RepID=UPI0014461541|nr:uncharacterized protein LOC117254623 isoform X2 [Epinephelus lanceolatus]